MDNITKYECAFTCDRVWVFTALAAKLYKIRLSSRRLQTQTHSRLWDGSVCYSSCLPVWALRKVIMGNGGSPGSRGLHYEIIMNPRGYRGLTAHKRDLLSGQVCNCLCPSANKSWSFSVTRWTKGQGHGDHFNYNMTFYIFVCNVFIIPLSLSSAQGQHINYAAYL